MRSGIQPVIEKATGVPDICYALVCLHIAEREIGRELTDEEVVDYINTAVGSGYLDKEGWVIKPWSIVNMVQGVSVYTGVKKVKAGEAFSPPRDYAIYLEKHTAKASYTHFVHPDGFDPMGDRPARLGYKLSGFRLFY